MNRHRNISRRVHGGYQLVWVPKKRMKVVFVGGSLRRYLGNFLNEPAKQKSIFIVEGDMLNDFKKGYCGRSEKHAQPSVVGCLKGKGVLEISWDFKRSQKPVHERSHYAKRYSAYASDSIDPLSANHKNEDSYFAQSGWI
jgi:REP element-mobilizing transposase RayT